MHEYYEDCVVASLDNAERLALAANKTTDPALAATLRRDSAEYANLAELYGVFTGIETSPQWDEGHKRSTRA